MTQLTIRVRGELVRQGLENLAGELPQIGRRNIRTMVNRVVRRMQAYPSERPGQTYRRTGRLFYGWSIVSLPNGYQVENRASRYGREYAQWVVGDAYGNRQAWMHAGRWDKYRDVVDAEVEKLPDEIEQEIIMVARRNNL